MQKKQIAIDLRLTYEVKAVSKDVKAEEGFDLIADIKRVVLDDAINRDRLIGEYDYYYFKTAEVLDAKETD